eukprot:747273-Hanusia_phi.AAC.3
MATLSSELFQSLKFTILSGGDGSSSLVPLYLANEAHETREKPLLTWKEQLKIRGGKPRAPRFRRDLKPKGECQDAMIRTDPNDEHATNALQIHGSSTSAARDGITGDNSLVDIALPEESYPISPLSRRARDLPVVPKLKVVPFSNTQITSNVKRSEILPDIKRVSEICVVGSPRISPRREVAEPNCAPCTERSSHRPKQSRSPIESKSCLQCDENESIINAGFLTTRQYLISRQLSPLNGQVEPKKNLYKSQPPKTSHQNGMSFSRSFAHAQCQGQSDSFNSIEPFRDTGLSRVSSKSWSGSQLKRKQNPLSPRRENASFTNMQDPDSHLVLKPTAVYLPSSSPPIMQSSDDSTSDEELKSNATYFFLYYFWKIDGFMITSLQSGMHTRIANGLWGDLEEAISLSDVQGICYDFKEKHPSSGRLNNASYAKSWIKDVPLSVLLFFYKFKNDFDSVRHGGRQNLTNDGRISLLRKSKILSQTSSYGFVLRCQSLENGMLSHGVRSYFGLILKLKYQSRQVFNRKFSVINFMSMFKSCRSREDNEENSEASDIKEDYELSLMVEKYAPGEDSEYGKYLQNPLIISPSGQSPDHLSNVSMSPGHWDYVVVEDSMKPEAITNTEVSQQCQSNISSGSFPPRASLEPVSVRPGVHVLPEKSTKRSKIEVYEGEQILTGTSPRHSLSPIRPPGARPSLSPNVAGRNVSRWVSADHVRVRGKRGEVTVRCSSFPEKATEGEGEPNNFESSSLPLDILKEMELRKSSRDALQSCKQNLGTHHSTSGWSVNLVKS